MLPCGAGASQSTVAVEHKVWVSGGRRVMAGQVRAPSTSSPPRRPPDAMAEIVGLKNKKCVACEGGIEPLPESEINRLQKQVR